jgi:signal transduction histidine kinase
MSEVTQIPVSAPQGPSGPAGIGFHRAGEKREARRPRVLVADDELHIRRAISLILGTEFDVTAVESGDRAFEQIREGADFDVVSLDVQMPGMSGIETLKAIKEWDPKIEVLLVTAHSQVDTAKAALKLGAYEFIDKPFTKEALRNAVRKGIERKFQAMAAETAREKLVFVKAQLMESEKFAALGQLIAGVVHELNNPISVIMGLSDLMLLKERTPEEYRSFIQNISQSATLCKNIIQKLLIFSRRREKKREIGSVTPAIESTLALKEHDFKIHGIQLVRQMESSLPATVADFSELQQVFLNILTNADQAMKDWGGSRMLTVKTEHDDRVIRISFQDTGPGIPKENLQRIFEPLFTTKKEGEGKGLGLSLCCEIVQSHDGSIYVASEPGQGACFIIEIPIVQKPHQETELSKEG